jgi:signal transduction histidine kinase
LLSSNAADDPMNLITQEAAIAADADFATLAMSEGDDQLVVRSVYGMLADELLGRTDTIKGSLEGIAMQTGKPLLETEFDGDTVMFGLPTEIGTLIVVPLATGEGTRGVLSLCRLRGRSGFADADLSMAATFGNHAAMALELVDARADQLQLAQLEDHDRIARDLHDHVIQEVFAVGIGLQGVAGIIDRPEITSRMTGYVDALDRVINQIRATIFRLHLGPQYGSLKSRLLGIAAQHTPQLGFAPNMELNGPLEEAVSPALADDVLAVTREALSNCARHAGAHSVEVRVEVADGVLRVEVTDDGRGVDNPSRSSGLTHMRERAKRHGGTFDISTPTGGGSRLQWIVPLGVQ